MYKTTGLWNTTYSMNSSFVICITINAPFKCKLSGVNKLSNYMCCMRRVVSVVCAVRSISQLLEFSIRNAIISDDRKRTVIARWSNVMCHLKCNQRQFAWKITSLPFAYGLAAARATMRMRLPKFRSLPSWSWQIMVSKVLLIFDLCLECLRYTSNTVDFLRSVQCLLPKVERQRVRIFEICDEAQSLYLTFIHSLLNTNESPDAFSTHQRDKTTLETSHNFPHKSSFSRHSVFVLKSLNERRKDDVCLCIRDDGKRVSLIHKAD